MRCRKYSENHIAYFLVAGSPPSLLHLKPVKKTSEARGKVDQFIRT